MATKALYKVIFLNHGKVYELYSESVGTSGLWGFIEISELVFETGDADGVFGVESGSGEASPLLTGEGKYTQMTLSDEGGHVGFLTNRDDWEADDPGYALY